MPAQREGQFFELGARSRPPLPKQQQQQNPSDIEWGPTGDGDEQVSQIR